MATELAKAYVQIIPSSEGLKGSISKIIEPEAESAGKSGGNKLVSGMGSVLKGAAGIAGAVVTATAAATASLAKSAVESYADYEQLVGGIETLFGTKGAQSVEEYAQMVGKSVEDVSSEYEKLTQSQQTMLDNANAAYVNAGLSANDYMETVTGFSASLLQGLGGDTQAAADVANRAVIDMSDNANKMGTSMESIQNAYQGFAKQNYTMLDNLKLGYGGTKEEMARLIEDASKMTDIQSQLGLTVDANSMSFDNIINAISVMQSSLGIAGTTSKEAATTISGSIGMMKASWQNLITGLADDNANFDQLINNLVSSIETVIPNIMPRITTALSGMANLISQLAPILIAEVPKLVSTLLPQFISAIGQISTSIAAVLPELIQTISLTIVNNLPTIINAGIEIMLALILGISQSLPELIPSIVEAVLTIVDTLLDNIDLLIDAAIQLTMGLAEGFIQALPILIEKLPEIIIKVADALIRNLPILLEAIVQLFMKLAEAFMTYAPILIQKIPELMNMLKEKFIALCSALAEVGQKIVNTIKQAIAEKWAQVTSSVSGWMDNLKAKFKEAIEKFKSVGSDIVGGIKQGIEDAWDGITSWFHDKVSNLVATAKEALKIGSPSKVFAREVGKWIPYGMAKGIDDNLAVVRTAVNNMTDYALESAAVDSLYDPAIYRTSYDYSRNGRVGLSSGYNQTVNIYSPTALSPSEVARQTRNSTRNMVLALRGV